jgi:hypothetical protein
MCDGKRVDTIDSKGVATARACRVVTGVWRKEDVASDKWREEDRRISVVERRQREGEGSESGGVGHEGGLERHRS